MLNQQTICFVSQHEGHDVIVQPPSENINNNKIRSCSNVHLSRFFFVAVLLYSFAPLSRRSISPKQVRCRVISLLPVDSLFPSSLLFFISTLAWRAAGLGYEIREREKTRLDVYNMFAHFVMCLVSRPSFVRACLRAFV